MSTSRSSPPLPCLKAAAAARRRRRTRLRNEHPPAKPISVSNSSFKVCCLASLGSLRVGARDIAIRYSRPGHTEAIARARRLAVTCCFLLSVPHCGQPKFIKDWSWEISCTASGSRCHCSEEVEIIVPKLHSEALRACDSMLDPLQIHSVPPGDAETLTQRISP